MAVRDQGKDTTGLGGVGDPGGQELFVCARPLVGMGQRLPASLRQLLVDAGVAHFLIVLREETSGTMTQWDFGPVGCDTTLFGRSAGNPRGSLLASLLPAPRRRRARVPGEIRELEVGTKRQVAELPAAQALFVGRTTMSISDIRQYNASHAQDYELNVNDCRHYVNALVHRATGVQGATALVARHAFRQTRCQRSRWVHCLADFAHALTDPRSWPRIRAAGQATAAVAALLGMRPLLRQGPVLGSGLGLAARRLAAPRRLAAARLQLAVQQRGAAQARGVGQRSLHLSLTQQHSAVATVALAAGAASRHPTGTVGKAVRSMGSQLVAAARLRRATDAPGVRIRQAAAFAVAAVTATRGAAGALLSGRAGIRGSPLALVECGAG